MPELLAVQKFVTAPRDVEAIRWDGTADSAPAIIAWIESKGEHAKLLREGDDNGFGFPIKHNYLSIGVNAWDPYLNASPGDWIVLETDRYEWRSEMGDFDLCEDGEMIRRYRSA